MNFEIAPKSTEIQANWNDATLYCFSLNIDGKIGWRLPTKEELNQIYQSENDFEKYFYWSSTENYGDGAWLQGFAGGTQVSHSKINIGINTRAVRDLKDN